MNLPNTIDLNNYTVINKVGQGSFGEVYKVKDKNSGEIYAAKISFKPLEENSLESIHDLSREVNILSKIRCPTIIEFIGFSSKNFHGETKPVIITEYLSNGSLYDIISLERRSLSNIEWNSTRKLITIYGIASSMKYLHAHNILHRDLKPSNILMDDFLCPKIGDFGLSKIQHSNRESITIESTLEIKGSPAYISPEVWKNLQYTKASDVYSFGILLYEIITVNEPYKNCDIFKIRSKVIKGNRPEISSIVPDSYRSLIERCWAQKAQIRPSFDEIVYELKEDDGFIDDTVEIDDFLDYVEYIDNYESLFDSKKVVIPIDKFIKRKTKTFKKISIQKTSKNDSNPQKHLNYPSKEFKRLNIECQQLVEEAEYDIDAQYEVGMNLIEGKKNFSQNTELGIKYLERSIEGGNIESAIYYCRLLIEDIIIPKDLLKAKNILRRFVKSDNSYIPFLYGKIKKEEGDYKSAFKYFEISSRSGNGESQYELGKMLYHGHGCEENKKEAKKYFLMSKNNGIDKSDKYLNKYETDQNKTKQHTKVRRHHHQQEQMYDSSSNKETNLSQSKLLYEKAVNYFYGYGIPMNKKEAARLFKMSIDKGNDYAMCSYAKMLYEGDHVPMNKAEAAHYYKMAIDKGNDYAMNGYANMLREGDGIPMNKTEAARFYKMAIGKGNDASMCSYANMLRDGDGVQMNKKEAVRFYKMAISKGNDYAMNNYANMLREGDGIPMDKTEAARLYKMSIGKGNHYAMNGYANMLREGDGVKMNKIEAVRLYIMAISKGNDDAMNNYANMLREGDGVQMNKIEAARLYIMAISKGNPYAMNSYANMLFYGDGVLMNKPEAARLYKMAIDKGNYFAMLNYAKMLLYGDGVPMNKKEADRLYKMANKKGNDS